jgi:signal transduction histidine kinase
MIVVDGMGGRLEIDSVEGEGTTVSVLLPCVKGCGENNE